jgi:AraC-like DNA-binding protein
MEQSSDKAAAVSIMQRYILAHLDEEITLDDLAGAANYSKFHVIRIFKELTHLTPQAYVRAMRLTHAAESLRDSDRNVVDLALQSGFDSHEGFTRAFVRQFGLTPKKYRMETPMIKAFVPYPIEAYYLLKDGYEPMSANEKVSRTVTVSRVDRPARKLIFLRTPGKGYFEDCEAVGCEWEGYYNSIPERFTQAAGGILPGQLVAPGTSGSAFLVEVPLTYDKPIPQGYEIAELPQCTYLYFCGMPYEDENDFCIAIDILNEAIENYPFERMGWRKSDNAPCMGLGADTKHGAEGYVAVESS